MEKRTQQESDKNELIMNSIMFEASTLVLAMQKNKKCFINNNNNNNNNIITEKMFLLSINMEVFSSPDTGNMRNKVDLELIHYGAVYVYTCG